MLPTAQRRHQQNTERIKCYVGNRGDERGKRDDWLGNEKERSKNEGRNEAEIEYSLLGTN